MSRRIKRHNENSKVRTASRIAVFTAVLSMGFAFTTNTASALSISGAISFLASQLKTQRLNDAWKTVTAQDSVASAALAETIVKTKQTQATTEAQLLRKENLIDLYNDFIGKGAITDSSRCVAVNERKNEVNVPLKSQLLVRADIANHLNTAAFSDESLRQVALQGLKNSVACTLDQAKQGYCTPTLSGGQYFDVDYGMVLASDRLMDTQFIAAKAGVMTIADPLPDKTTMTACNGDTACSANVAAQNSRIAVNSLVNNSLLSQLYNRMAVGADNENQ